MAIDKDGKPSRMGIISLDSRSGDVINGWMADGRYVQAMQKVSMPFGVGSPMPILAWFKANAVEEYKNMDKVMFSKDWIRYKLSDVFCTDQTDASSAGLMDLSKSEYAYDVFDLLGIADIRSKLPNIRQSHEVVGSVTKVASQQTGLIEGTPVLCGATDIAAYPFGIGSVDSKQLAVVFGTWGLNIIPVKSFEGLLVALYHTVPGYYLTGLGDGNSGGCLDIIIDTLCENEKILAHQNAISVYEYIENMIVDSKPTSILFHPYIFGSIFNNSASAGFYGIKNWHKKADVLRAVYEGIVMGYYAYIQAIPGNDKFESMWLIGGGTKSKILGQMFADVTGLTVKMADTSEITARGGALCALVGLGVYANFEEASIPPSIRVEYKPNPEMQSFYQKKFVVFNEISQANTNIWSKLSELNI
jgi:L-xylulokinase